MSSRSTTYISGLCLLAVGGLGVIDSGCVDPKKGFDDFAGRVVDADTTRIDGTPLGEIPDVTGEFLVALSPAVSRDSLLEFIVTVELDTSGGQPIIKQTFQPLCVQSELCTVRQPHGESFTTKEGEDVTINSAGEFTAILDNVPVAGGANPISGQDIKGQLTMLGTLKTKDLYCGMVNGKAGAPGAAPVDLDRSTFGAIRIEPGTLGDDLPEPVAECPKEPIEADAGVPDAMPVDAGAEADAGPEADAEPMEPPQT